MSKVIVTQSLMDDANDLIASGDLVLANEREKFRKLTGRTTAITDEALKVALMACEDEDDELFVRHVLLIEAYGYTILKEETCSD